MRGRLLYAIAGLGLLVLGALNPACGQAANKSPAELLYGPRCLEKLRQTTAVNAQGRLRFALHKPEVPYSPDRPPDTILTVDPARTDIRLLDCTPRLSPDGALQVNAVSFWLTGGPDSVLDKDIAPARGAFWATFAAMAPSAIEYFSKESIQKGYWLPKGLRFGLSRYQHVIGFVNGKPSADSHYLGAYFVGTTPGGHFIRISCVDFDVTLDIACNLDVQMQSDVLLGMEIPTGKLEKWPQYVAPAEKYFSQNLERK